MDSCKLRGLEESNVHKLLRKDSVMKTIRYGQSAVNFCT